ncbi:hypothetical protein DU002_14950 [Corallincola holothuriorum]|uniref:Type 4 fimbrial biogenesis protein PilX N-terminal domain-containing protein n=1 Tax=Corallincola holothuriorum TaxID=2282215 RepID=A0A368N823_9GAMM|nr:hypothetical protein [Corallincola holothuriorum]RCU45751.1 hypothetical protein DU002_14950 [Corallincola holothuriorum]
MNNAMTRQSGAVLIIGLLLLVAITSTAVVLVSNSQFDLKLAGAASAQSESRQIVAGGVDDVVVKAFEGRLDGNRKLTNIATNTELNIDTSLDHTTANLNVVTDDESGQVIDSCRPRHKPSEVELIKCRYARVLAEHKFNTTQAARDSGMDVLIYQYYPDPNQN